MAPMDTTGAQFSMLSQLRTGSVIVDMVIAMLVPITFRWVFDGRGKQWLDGIVAKLYAKVSTRRECVRSIVVQNSMNRGCRPINTDEKNDLLMKALTLYITDVMQTKFPGKSRVALTALEDMRNNWERPKKYDPLDGYRLSWLAPEKEFVKLTKDIEFRQFSQQNGVEQNGNEQTPKAETVFELKSTSVDGHAMIDALLEKAVKWYKAELLKLRDDSRYLYTMKGLDRLSLSSSDKDDDSQHYKRYKLSDHKTFDSLFFPEKTALQKLLHEFTERKGKYSVKGYPHKLGLLLHGPPGTGKTSLIKALAHATNRSIISVPLALIKTNSMLMDVMYDLKLKVDGAEVPQLSFRDVIFVIEDVDAASKVVLRRDGKEGTPTASKEGTPTASSDGTAEEMAADAASAVGDTALARELRALATSQAAAASQPPSESSDAESVGPKPPSMLDAIDALMKPRPDELNLAGLLNVLDGVVDTPGRILVMTSNHPEKLDPAIIRPGRIDRQIFLGCLRPSEAAQMMSHYFAGPVDVAQRERLERLLAPPAAVSPAMLEQECARHSTVDELLDGLSELGKPAAQAEKEVEPAAPKGEELVMLKRQISGG